MIAFESLFKDETRFGTKIKTDDYLEHGKHPIVDQGQNEVAGYTNLEDGIYADVPAVIFGDHTRVIKYIDEPFFLGADGTKILKGYKPHSNQKYLYYALRAAKIPNLGYSRHFKCLKELKFVEHSEDEQQQIVAELDKLSEIISLKTKELSLYDELIKARFVEMFGMPGTDPFSYGIKELGKCCELNPKKAQEKRLASNIDVSFVPMSSVSENGDIDPTDIRSYEEVKKGFTYFAENDVLFAKITPCMENGKGAVARSLKNGIGFGSTEFHVLRPIKDISNPYWIYALTSFKSFRKDAEANMTGSAGQRRTPASFLNNYKVALPPIYLQNQFAAFVAQVDKSKFAVQKSLEKTQLLFDSLMQEYFG